VNKYNIILDTDIGNSWDDQFALVYLLKNQELFDFDAITIEPFKHYEDENIIENEIISYNEIINIGALLNIDLSCITFKFSNDESVNKIIDVAHKNEKTYILAIGGLTNIYKAIKQEPDIINNVEVIWLGGNSIDYGNNKEFNFIQDIEATTYLINSDINMTIIPTRNVVIDLMISINELTKILDMNTELSKYLCDRFLNDKYYGVKEHRVIWDISAVAYMKNKDWFEVVNMSNLYVDNEYKYNESININSNVKMIKSLDNEKIYEDFFNSMTKVM